MKEIISGIIYVSALIFLASIFAIGAYLYRAKIYTTWQLRTTFLWPKIIFEYRDHTKKYQGTKGIWYGICKVSFLVLFAAVLASIVPQILLLPKAIAVAVFIFAATIVPAIGYAIYGLSKERYY